MPLREIPGPLGTLEALLDEPERPPDVAPNGNGAIRAAVVVGHPHPQYGGTMHTKVVYQTAKALARIGCAALRFNFRGIGRSAGVYDEGRGEQDDFSAALDFMQARYPETRLWAAGMSFGAAMGLRVGARDSRVSTLVGIAVPIDRYDFEQVRLSPKPKFFIHAERDEIAPLKAIQAFYARAVEPKELVVIDGADHVFDGKVSEVADAIEDLLGDWEG